MALPDTPTPQEIITAQIDAISTNSQAILQDVRAINARVLSQNPPANLREETDEWLQNIESAIALMDQYAARPAPNDFLAASKKLVQQISRIAWNEPLFFAMRDCLYPDNADEKIGNRFAAELMNKAQTLYLKNMAIERHMAMLPRETHQL